MIDSSPTNVCFSGPQRVNPVSIATRKSNDWLKVIGKVHANVHKRHQNGNIFRVTGPLCGNSPVTAEFSQRPLRQRFRVFFGQHLNKQNKQSSRRWFETPSRSLWRHCNVRLSKKFIYHRKDNIKQTWSNCTDHIFSSALNLLQRRLNENKLKYYIWQMFQFDVLSSRLLLFLQHNCNLIAKSGEKVRLNEGIRDVEWARFSAKLLAQ